MAPTKELVMTSDPVHEYLAAVALERQARKRVASTIETVKVLCEAMATPGEWKRIAVTNVPVQFPEGNFRKIDGNAWPSAAHLATVLSAWHTAMADVNFAWGQLSDEQKASGGLIPPGRVQAEGQ